MDVDQEADRTDPDGPVLGQDQQGERRHEGRLLLVEEILEVLEQRTEVEQLPRQEAQLTHVVLELRTEDVQV